MWGLLFILNQASSLEMEFKNMPLLQQQQGFLRMKLEDHNIFFKWIFNVYFMVQPNVTMFTFWEVAGGRLSFGRCGVGIVGGGMGGWVELA